MAEKTVWRCGMALAIAPLCPGNHAKKWVCPAHGENWRLTQEQVIALQAKAALCDELAKAIRPGADAHRGDRHETPFQRLIDKYDELEAK